MWNLRIYQANILIKGTIKRFFVSGLKVKILVIAIIPTLCFGQYYFGQNKVQYTDFDWHVLTTEHFNVYFYPEEEYIAQIGAKLAEESYDYLVEKFNHVIDKKIPLILYSSPVYFTQTNVIPGILPESVAGFTEFFKERVVVPYNGSYSDLAHVIRHELVHVFMMEKIMYVCKSHRRRNPPRSPLWFTEGIAEFWSQGWDTKADMVVRDMVISGKIVSFDQLYTISGTFLMYKVGQSICKYLSETYGDDRLTLLFENWWKEPSFSLIVEQTFGKSLMDIGEDWEYYLKKKYYPYLKDQDLPDRSAERLTKKHYNVKPTVFSNGSGDSNESFIAFKTIRLGYPNIALMPLSGEKAGLKRVIKGGRSARFESLHFIDSNIDASIDGCLTFVSKSHESDVLYIYDTNKDKIVADYKFEEVVSINSPSWSPDGKKIVFVGAGKDGQTDIYLYNTQTDKLVRLTDDFYYDQTPSFSYDEKYIAFSSDRSGFEEMNIFTYELETGNIKQLTFGEYENLSPRWAFASDRMLFTSDMNGTSNIFLLENPHGPKKRLIQLTSFITGVFDPVFTPDDSAIVFSGYQNFDYHIYKMKLETANVKESKSQTKSQTFVQSWQPEGISGDYIKGNVKYKTKFSFDIAQSAISYDAVFGSMGGLQTALTDVLGNHQYYFLIYNTADTKTDIINSINVGLTYLNRKKRLNWGLGLYRFYDEYNDDYYGFVSEETYGGLAVASYPFSRYDRIEMSVYLRKLYKEFPLTHDYISAKLTTGIISYIKDTSIWDPSGPIDGFRAHLTVAHSLSLQPDSTMKNSNHYNSWLNVDVRKYFRLSEASAYAIRAVYFTSNGQDPQRRYLGGSWDLRGYPRRSFYGRNMFLLNNELRFPLVDRLYIGFPFGSINFQAIRGALFFDAGKAWDEEVDNHLEGSFGFGIRVSLGYVTVLRFDFARRTDFRSVENGFKFDFFFGWNY